MLQFLGRGIYLLRNMTYFVAYIAFGLYKIALGPLIPYLSEASGKVQTQYSFLFACRAVGMLAGSALFYRYQNWQNRPSRHKMLTFCFTVFITTNFFFIWSQTAFFQGFWTFATAINLFFIELLIDLCIISLGKNIDQLLLLSSASNGIGSLCSPIFVRLLGLNSFSAFGIIAGAIIPLIFYLPSPDIKQDKKIQEEIPCNKMKLNEMTIILLCAGYFFYKGLLIIKLGWSSSFAVMACNMTKQQATVFPSLFSAFNIGTKFLWIFIPINGGRRLMITTKALVLVSLLSIVPAKLGQPQFALYFDSIALSMLISPLSSIILSIGSEYGRPLTAGQISKLMTWGVIGEGMLTLLCGSIMSSHINIYYYISVAVGLSLWLSSRQMLRQLQRKNIVNPEEGMLEMQLIK